MRHGSIIGPVILILIGGLFLLHNISPQLPILQLAATWWPFLLIVWGLIRAAEILVWSAQGKPLPASGISGGEWFLAILITLAGSALFVSSKYTDRFSRIRISSRGLDLFGESFDFPLSGSFKSGKAPRIQIDNLRGNARITAADVEEITVTGRHEIRAFDRADADNVNRQAPLEIVQQGDVVVIRTNQERASGSVRISSDLEITVPKASSIKGRGRYGDFDITGLGGNVEIESDNAGVRVNDLGGSLRTDLRRSDIVRAINVKGGVDLRGGGGDVELENVEGPVNVNGSFYGDLTFRKLAKPLRFESRNTTLRLEKLSGFLQISRGDFTAEDFSGGFHLKTGSRDVRLTSYDGPVEVEVEKGDIELRPGRLPLAATSLRSQGGELRLVLPDNAQFEIEAELDRGDVSSDFTGLRHEDRGRGARLTGSVGRGPKITVNARRGSISLRKSSAAPPAPPAPPQPAKPVSAPRESLSVTQQ